MNFDINDATAPTPARSFGNFVNIMSKSVKERMGRWEVRLGPFPYKGIRRGPKIRTLNPVYARQKSKQIQILKPAGRGIYQGTLHYCTHETSEVWCTSTSNIESLKLNQSFLVLLCTAVCCNELVTNVTTQLQLSDIRYIVVNYISIKHLYLNMIWFLILATFYFRVY